MHRVLHGWRAARCLTLIRNERCKVFAKQTRTFSCKYMQIAVKAHFKATGGQNDRHILYRWLMGCCNRKWTTLNLR